jgi:hypothetical protein
MASGQKMADEAEEIIERAVSRKRTLGLPWRFAATHVTLLLARRLMQHFGSIVCSFVLAVRNTGHEFPPSRSIIAQLIGHQPARDVP